MQAKMKAYGLLSMPVILVLALYGAVQTNPTFISHNFPIVWFLMVLVVITASLGLLWVALQMGKEEEEHDHEEGHKEAAD